MSCRVCGEEETFTDGNEAEELCKHCLDHCCEECFGPLLEEAEYENHLCESCYGLHNNVPEHFTFHSWEIEEFEF